ncbi:MAG TPA: hypothetical protein VGH58_09170 [Solirubrobacterales bacterium]
MFSAAACVLGIVASPASAVLPTHAELPALNQTGFERVCGLAVDSAGNRYVAEFTAQEVKVYSPSGTLITSFATSANGASPCGLAVDSQGDVYVNGRLSDVAKYKPSSFPPTASTTYAPDTSVNTNGVLTSEGARGVAVNPANDDVYVSFSGHISSYQPDGTPISETIGEAAVPGAAFSGLGVRGSTGKIYAYDSESAKAYVLSPDGSKVLTEVDGSGTQAGSFQSPFHGLAVDQSNGHFYLSDVGPAEGGHRVVDEFDSGGELVSELPTPPALKDANPTGLAADNSGGENEGDVFISAGQSPSSVIAFGPLTYAKFFHLKVVKTGPGHGTVTSSAAGVNCGTVCEVSVKEGTEVILTATAEPGSGFATWQGCNTVIGNECKMTMLANRKITAKFNAKPAIESENVLPRVTSAVLEATINPNGEETSYQFEYLSEDAYQANGESFSGPEEALTAPASPESAGNGYEGVPVSAEIAGLTAHTAYRFRVVATNSLGDAEGKAFAFTTYLPPQVFEPCSNDAYRSGAGAALPDCRAYEQASPVDKNFGDVTGSIEQTRASVEGNRVSFAATSPIPGGEGSGTFDPLYLATRGPNGWSTQGMLPPEREGGVARVSSWTPDFAHVFSWARALTQPERTTLLERSTISSSLTTIVPHTAGFSEPAVAGSSADGSVVFFENTGAPLVPEAPDSKPNLYAWDRGTDTYRLAGIFNDEKAPAGGSIGGSYDWMLAGRGNDFYLGSGGAKSWYYTRDQHVVAPDGSSVYFTAGKTGQLYLRENPTDPQSEVVINGSGKEECIQPELACTIHVSASQKTNGPGGGPDPAGAQPAAFLGASTDGSKAFFTSSEMLTNDANTGPEQPPAQIGRAKIGATEAEEVEPDLLPKHALGLATSPDGAYLYWVDSTQNTIGRAKLNGSGQPTEIDDEYIVPGETSFETHPIAEPGVFHSAPSVIRHIAVDDEHVYWTNRGPLGDENNSGTVLFENILNGAGTIGRAKIGASKGEVVEPEFITGASDPQGVAVNESDIYWVNRQTSAIARAAIGGGEVDQAFASSSGAQVPSDLALDSSYVYFDTSGGATETEFSFIRRVPLEGGGEEFVGIGGENDSSSKPRNLVINGPYIYWASEATGMIGRTLLTDFHEAFPHNCFEISTCDYEYAKLEGAPFGLASDGERLYWSVNGEGGANPGNDLYRYDVGSGALTDLAPHSEGNGAEVRGLLGSSDDGSYVYFVASAALTEDASPGGCHGQPEALSGVCDLYVAHEGQLSFIAPLNSATDRLDWNETTDPFKGRENGQKKSRVSPDGKTLLFSSTKKLTAYDNNSREELYRYRFGDPDPILCVSCNPTDLPPGGGPMLGSIELAGFSSIAPTSLLSRNLSADGNRVFFETSEALVAEDTNGNDGCTNVDSLHNASCRDLYEWEAKGTGSCESEAQNGGCLYLISTGKSSGPSYFLDASASGNDVFFFTRDHLVGSDTDSFVDVYDARVGGGLASQNEAPPPPPCEAEGCKGGASPAPQISSPTTPLFSGPGNPKPHHKKPKAKKGRHKKHSHKHKRHTKSNGRAQR